MPNTVVKLINAESTWPEAAREDRKLLIKRNLAYMRGIFFYAQLPILFEIIFSFCLSRFRGMAPGGAGHLRSYAQSYICAMFISFFPGEERNEPKKEATDQ